MDLIGDICARIALEIIDKMATTLTPTSATDKPRVSLTDEAHSTQYRNTVKINAGPLQNGDLCAQDAVLQDYDRNITTSPTHKDEVWTNIRTCTLAKLRDLGKELRVARRTRKSEYCRAIFYAVQCSNKEWTSTITHAMFPEFSVWRNIRSRMEFWYKSPVKDFYDESQPIQSSVSISNLARLLSILTYDDQLCHLLIKSSAVLTYAELDTGVDPHEFQETHVVPLYMIPSLVTCISFTDELVSIDASLLSEVHRSGTELRKLFNEVRSQFTMAYSRWTKSGQNDPSNFIEFCHQNKQTGNTSTAGKHYLVMFKTYRCGTNHEVSDVTTYNLRLMSTEMQVDSGVSDSISRTPRGSRDRKRSFSLLTRHIDHMNNQASNLTDALTRRPIESSQKDLAEVRYKKWLQSR